MRYRFFFVIGLVFGMCLASTAGWAAEDVPHVDGNALNLWWGIPFVGILLSIAIFPLIAPEFWHRYYGMVSAFWASAFLLPFALFFGLEIAGYEFLHILLLDYIPFIILLGTLFTVSGGIYIQSPFQGTPLTNTVTLSIGTILASFMGTTGAAMVFIRPLLRANRQRLYRIHTVVFFIFLVTNIGGSLTPLGDPPLFLGFLKGVDFSWPLINMFFPMLFMSVSLLTIYYIIDSWCYRKEGKAVAEVPVAADRTFHISGKINLFLLLCVLGTVVMQGIWKSSVTFEIYHVVVPLQMVVANAILVSIGLLSLLLTRREVREGNEFNWFPILEVAKLFGGIFLTIIPMLAMLKAGETGPTGFIIALVSDNQGMPLNQMYFWVTGILSSFLDNAPTYLVFFNTAGGNAEILMTELRGTLLAISTGAVFMGACTYIGNAPNFMVRSIALNEGIPMPSFFGFIGWSVVFLIPLFVAFSLLFL